MRWPALGFVIGVAIAPSPVLAQPPVVALAYEVPPDAQCPDGPAFEARVGSRLGYLPFDPTAGDQARVSVARDGRELVGALAIEIDGALTSRQTRASESECGALVDALAWLLAMAIDPDALAAAAPADELEETPPALSVETAPEEAPPAVARPVEAAPAAAPVSAPKLRVMFGADEPSMPSPHRGDRAYGFLQVGGGLSAFALPGDVGPVVALAGGLVVDDTYELRLDVAWTAVQGRETASGRVAATSIEARASACLMHVGVVGGCVVAGVGAVPAWAEVPGSTVAIAPRVTLALRGIARWEWTDDVGIALEIETGPVLVRPELAFGEAVAWTAPELFFEARVPLYVRLW